MEYCKNYCVEKGISVSKLNEAQRILYYIAENMMLTNSISEEGYRDFQIAIKTLEQEPFINKTCVSEGVCNEDKIKVLDKISAEIEREEDWLKIAGYNAYNVYIAFNSLKLLVKESRGKE